MRWHRGQAPLTAEAKKNKVINTSYAWLSNFHWLWPCMELHKLLLSLSLVLLVLLFILLLLNSFLLELAYERVWPILSLNCSPTVYSKSTRTCSI